MLSEETTVDRNICCAEESFVGTMFYKQLLVLTLLVVIEIIVLALAI